MNARLLDMFAHPHHVSHVLVARHPLARRAVLLYVSVLSRLNNTHPHENPHLIRRPLYLLMGSIQSLTPCSSCTSTPILISSGISDGSRIPNSGLMSRLSCVSVCKDISIVYHSLLFLLLMTESHCLLLCLCLLFVPFVFL